MPFSSATSTCTQSPEQAMIGRSLTPCGFEVRDPFLVAN